MTQDNVTLLTSRIEINLAPSDKACSKDALNMMPQWRLTVPVTVKYLTNLDAPVAKSKIHHTTVTITATNYKLTEWSHPKLGSLFSEANVIRLQNCVLEQ